jgi:hypothetical protein
MADIRKIEVDTFVQVIRKGKANAKARVVGKTPKMVYVQIMEGNKYVTDEKTGEPKRTRVYPKSIKFYTKNEKSEKVESTNVADEVSNEVETVEGAEEVAEEVAEELAEEVAEEAAEEEN